MGLCEGQVKDSVFWGVWGTGEAASVCQIQGWIAQKATQEAKFELVGSLSCLLHVLGIYRRNVMRNQENVKFLLVYFCHFFSLSSKLIGAKD